MVEAGHRVVEGSGLSLSVTAQLSQRFVKRYGDRLSAGLRR